MVLSTFFEIVVYVVKTIFAILLWTPLQNSKHNTVFHCIKILSTSACFTLDIKLLHGIYEIKTRGTPQMRKNRCCLSVALLLPAGFKSRSLVYLSFITIYFSFLTFSLCNFLVRTLQYLKKTPFFPMKTRNNDGFFPLIGLSCPYGQKMNFHIWNWSVAPFVSFCLFLTEQAWSHGGLRTRELGQDPSHVSMGD